jgi:hypothetical protein
MPDIEQEDINQSPSRIISEGGRRSDTHATTREQYALETRMIEMESLASRRLSAGSIFTTVDEYQEKVSLQGTERAIDDKVLPDELFDDLALVNLRAVPDEPTSRLLFVIDEEDDPTPPLTRTSRPSTADSDSVDSASLSSFGNGDDDVHVLMDVDDISTPQGPTMRNRELRPGTVVRPPSPPLEESVARLSKLYKAAYGSDGSRRHGADSKVNSPMPVLAQLAESTRSYSPSKVLSKIRQYRTKQSMTVTDFEQVRHIADFFSAAQSYADAFRLYQFIFDRMMAQESKWSPSAVLHLAIDVTRTATSTVSHKEVAGLMKNVISKIPDFLSPITREACMLHSHLGNNFRARNDLESAERHCRLGLSHHRECHHPSHTGVCRIILDTNLLLVLEDKGGLDAARNLRNRLRLDLAKLETDTIGGAVKSILSELLFWCHDAIAEEDLQALSGTINGCNDNLWIQGNSNDLREFETTLLFCHLWKQWRLAGKRSLLSTQHRNPQNLLAQVENSLGITPIDALAALSTLILGFADLEENYSKSTLAVRILFSSQKAFTKHRVCLYSDFLHAHAAPLRTKSKRFSTDEYATLVQGFVQGFADLHLYLHLSETAFQEPGLRSRANRFSSSSSVTPTMLSTPRSSWSGYASFKSLSRRTKLASPVIASDGQSIASSDRRLSLSTLNSSRSNRGNSFMNVDPEDIVMEDVATVCLQQRLHSIPSPAYQSYESYQVFAIVLAKSILATCSMSAQLRSFLE